MRELRSGSGLAILTTKQIEAGSEEIEFEVETSQGQSTMWKRYLVQLGDVPVTYKCSAPRGGAVEADTFLVVIGFPKKYCHPDAWKTAMTRPKSATAYWLKKLGAEPVDFLPPRSGRIDGVEVVARVQKDNFEKVLRGSGEFGVFSRSFFVKGDARVYKDVPLPVEFDLQAALRKAKAVGPSILGGCLAGKGSLIAYEGVRLRECRWPGLLRGGCQVGLAQSKHPSGQGRPGVPSFGQRCRLPTADCNTIFGCSLIRPAEPRKRQRAQVMVWSKPGKTTVESQKVARSWASVVSAGRRGRAATGTHGVGTVDCDNCRTARGPAAFPPNRSHGDEKSRQRGRRVRRQRWRERGNQTGRYCASNDLLVKAAAKPSLTTKKNRQHFSENCTSFLANTCEMFTVHHERSEQKRTAKLPKATKTRLEA